MSPADPVPATIRTDSTDALASRHAWAKQGRQPAIAIIGVGMSGIAAVVKLRRAGYTDFVVYEKADRAGGNWRENSHPNLYPWSPERFRNEMKRPDFSEYHLIEEVN